jgi:aminoglycoside phosphotransferase (APT) family kinase protein
MSDPPLNEEALGAWLEANVEGFAPPFELRKFPSGQSNPTYRITAASGDYVLRRKPFGHCSRRLMRSTANIAC